MIWILGAIQEIELMIMNICMKRGIFHLGRYGSGLHACTAIPRQAQWWEWGGWLVVALGVMMYVEGDNNYR